MGRRNGTAGTAATTASVFGEVARHLRESAGLTQGELAGRLHCDRSWVARIEAGTRVPQNGFAEVCDQLFDTGGLLTRLWERIDWYAEAGPADRFRRRAVLDEEAVALREYQALTVPGLLQTEEYARALLGRDFSGEELEQRVRARLDRQRRLLGPGGPLLLWVLDESVIRGVVRGPEVMRDQCDRLLSVARRDAVRLQLAPFDARGLTRPHTSVTLISLAEGGGWVYSESLDRGHFTDDPTVFARHLRTLDLLRADALSPEDTAAVIREARAGYARDGRPPHRLGRPPGTATALRGRPRTRHPRVRHPRTRRRD
ncbi:helix-turn-helix transcriptional regulator [Streptomyces sp. NPDC005438]|uniref:helix-turn-helix domain-containing protein n=1 Tax=Streptomyces sp. NPDC005438 TaxID=3156880 RepID=UPI0033A356B4